jgi:hypothetical protein
MPKKCTFRIFARFFQIFSSFLIFQINTIGDFSMRGIDCAHCRTLKTLHDPILVYFRFNTHVSSLNQRSVFKLFSIDFSHRKTSYSAILVKLNNLKNFIKIPQVILENSFLIQGSSVCIDAKLFKI